jgi:hypothetical protein
MGGFVGQRGEHRGHGSLPGRDQELPAIPSGPPLSIGDRNGPRSAPGLGNQPRRHHLTGWGLLNGPNRSWEFGATSYRVPSPIEALP